MKYVKSKNYIYYSILLELACVCQDPFIFNLIYLFIYLFIFFFFRSLPFSTLFPTLTNYVQCRGRTSLPNRMSFLRRSFGSVGRIFGFVRLYIQRTHLICRLNFIAIAYFLYSSHVPKQPYNVSFVWCAAFLVLWPIYLWNLRIVTLNFYVIFNLIFIVRRI